MKKIILLLITMTVIISGCGKVSNEKLIKEFKDDVGGSKAYKIKAEMEILSDEDVFTYDVDVSYKKDDLYRVSLINKINNHEQIILKNKEGVYVVTPSLNKSFKFQSDWPKNSSQAYLLASIVEDIEREGSGKLTKTDDGYTIDAKVNYPNNPDLINEKIYFNKDMKLEKIEIFNEEGSARIKVKFNSIDYKASIKDEEFDLKELVDEDCCKEETKEETKKEEEKTTNKLEDIIYPLYVPANTYLTNKDTVSIGNGERVILTFAGEKNFILVEETSKVSSELEIIPVYGEPLMLKDSIGALSNNSLHWSSNKIDYYLTSDTLNTNELMTIAESLAVARTIGK